MNKEINNNSNISVILGDPNKAINKLAWPMVISMFLTMAYNLADGIWVAGLGTDALAALGFITPLFLIIVGLGNGLGAGANSLIARCIGAKDKKKADNSAIHSLIITVIISTILTIFFLIFLKDILIILSAGDTINLALEYGYLVMGGLFVFIFSNVGASILRSEGDVNRAMYAIAITAILNIIIDPIFIYTFNMGMAGAAWATVISAAISCIIIFYWLFIEKNTYLSFSKKDFKPNIKIVKDLLNVGLPASVESLLMSILSIIMNIILVEVSGNFGVAIFSAGWRIIMMAFIPHMGLGTALLTVAGAAYGAKKYEKLSLSFNYSLKLGMLISTITALLMFIFAPEISLIFSYTDQSVSFISSMTEFLRIMALFVLPLPIGFSPASLFQGVGKGMGSLIMSIIREIICTILFTLIFVYLFQMTEIGVWWGLVVGGFIGSIIALIWGKIYLIRLNKPQQIK